VTLHSASQYESFLCAGGPRNHFHHLHGEESFTQDRLSVQGLKWVGEGVVLKEQW